MNNRTALYDAHQKAGAKLVDFAGWEMPIHYGSQIEEHHYVRKDAGVFDVSHMTIVDIQGPEVKNYLQYLLANNIDRLQKNGKALYSCMLNEQGGVIDDLIVYKVNDDVFRMVVNAATREKDMAWLQKIAADFSVTLSERRDLAILAIQGPQAHHKVAQVLNQAVAEKMLALENFQAVLIDEWFIARTGYTGEDGLEIMLPHKDALAFWEKLLELGIHPCGLGARDTLRLEAGLNLYGTDMDENISPLEANLAWTIAWEPKERNFIGRTALELQKQQGIKKKFVGVILQEKGVLRNHQRITVENVGEGEITSGSFSPTLGLAIALARVPVAAEQHCLVDMRGKMLPARIIKPPFVRNGKKTFE